MEIGVTVRNMGPQSRPQILRACVEHAEAVGFESAWITDHIAIPPDDAEGSGGRYTDPLTTLAWLGGMTRRIRLGVGALILPYRPVLPTAKAIATAHELTGERLLIGVGLGWMDAEFRALGVERRQRGRITDTQLAFLNRCFSEAVVELNGQPFIFDPRPKQPPIYVGGRAPHALDRALRFDLGWLPMARDAEGLGADLALFERKAEAAGKRRGPVTAFVPLSVADPGRAVDELLRLRALGVERLVCAVRYDDATGYRRQLDQLAGVAGKLPAANNRR